MEQKEALHNKKYILQPNFVHILIDEVFIRNIAINSVISYRYIHK